jgi:DNA processing protein
MNSDLPPEAYAAALASFPHMSIHRLGALLRHHPPHEAYAVAVGDHRPDGLIERVLINPDVGAAWQRAGRSSLLDDVWDRCTRLGVRVLLHGAEEYPPLLMNDPLPPPVVFAQGQLDLLEGRRAGIVGTRNATAAGRDTATNLGRQLADADVHVVSGLARGIDGCAHRGALQGSGAGRPIAVVASGHDVVYPREHRLLWASVAECGLLLSECPPGTAP